ncbi:MAG TPA: NUDIX domain-containing protein [bacterium]|nr:NUDIX domain-containing protein [bacterium]
MFSNAPVRMSGTERGLCQVGEEALSSSAVKESSSSSTHDVDSGTGSFPGGRPENFEPIPAAVACEIREETGLDVDVEAPRRGLRGQRSVAPSRAKACVGYACRQRTREKHHVDHGDQ